MDNLGEMDRFFEKFNFLRLNQEEIETMNKPITYNRKCDLRNSPKTEAQGQRVPQVNSLIHLEKS